MNNLILIEHISTERIRIEIVKYYIESENRK